MADGAPLAPAMGYMHQGSLPPKATRKRKMLKSKGPRREWDDGFSVSKGIPEYKVKHDIYAQSYVQQIKKFGNHNKNYREAAIRPGGLRPVKQNSIIGTGQKYGNPVGLRTNKKVRPDRLESLSQQSSHS